MGQITSEIRALLSAPAIYDTLQNIMGAEKVRREMINEFIRPEAGSRILDLGCGTSEFLHYLPRNIEYRGYNISGEYISAAKSRYGSRGHFYCGLLDESSLATLPKFDRVLALGVLHHRDDEQAWGLFSLAHHALNDDGRMITNDPCLAAGQSAVARYLISKDRGQNVREAKAYASFANSSFASVDGTLRHRKWMPYTHWIMECVK